MSIDYEKLSESLANAIVAAETREREKYSVTREWMKFIIYPVLIFASLLSLALAVFSFYQVITKLLNLVSIYDLLKVLGFFALGLFSMTLSMITYWTSKELDEERDRQFVATILSIITALCALAVALVALLKRS